MLARRHLTAVFAITLGLAACSAQAPSDSNAAANAEALALQERQVAELAARSDEWVLEQVGGERIVLDGQTLDLRMQYLFHLGRQADEAEARQAAEAPETQEPEADPFDAPDSAATIRRNGNQVWISRTRPGPDILSVTDETIVARDGQPIPVRIYRPSEGPLPVLVYYHGGGWLFGDIEAVDRSIRRLAHEANVIVASIDYRLAPEHVYPGSWNDAEDAFDWAVANVSRLGGDASRICVGGDSAGGNMSVVVTARTQTTGKASPACQLLYYAAVDNRSIADMRVDYLSARLFWSGFGLDEPFTDYVHRRVFPGMNLSHPEISPIFADNFAAMPPTLVVAAGFDPLRDSDRAYAEALRQAGVRTVYLEYAALPHGFLQQTAVSAEADRASGETARAFASLVAAV